MANLRDFILVVVIVTFVPTAFADKVSDRVARAEARYAEEVQRAKDTLAKTYETALRRRTKQGDLDEALNYRAKLQSLNAPIPRKPRTTSKPDQPEGITSSDPCKTTIEPVHVKPVRMNGNLYIHGLQITEYPMRQSQEEDGAFIELTKLQNSESAGDERTTPSLDWQFKESRNAIAAGFLLIKEPGEYAFGSDNFYDRNALYVLSATKPVCSYQDTSTFRRIRIDNPGMIPIWSIGYVQARGTVTVQWKPPGQAEFSEVPSHLLFHKAPPEAQ
ncbi:MAG: hypothetical protein KDN22_22170 [Verrucomicrobiae bacterium]|nr:hypothetical protein [Verrucomicrobiae bacterium]